MPALRMRLGVRSASMLLIQFGEGLAPTLRFGLSDIFTSARRVGIGVEVARIRDRRTGRSTRSVRRYASR